MTSAFEPARPHVPGSLAREKPAWAFVVGFLAVALLTAAHLPMREHRLPLWAAVAFAAGVLLMIALAIRFTPPKEETLALARPAGGPRIVLVVLALAGAAATWRLTAGGVYRASGVAAWIATVVCWLAAWWPRHPSSPEKVHRRSSMKERLGAAGVLAAVLLVGTWFLFHDLDRTPGNPTSDHAEKLRDVLNLRNGERPIFFFENTGREPFQFYWTYALIQVLGLPLKYMTLKIGTALIGLAALPVLYLLGRELGGAPLGLAAAALAAWSKWPVSLARQGLRYPLGVLPTAAVLWALVRWLRRGDRASVLWAGLFIGAGLHGYVSFRIVPLLVPVAVLLALADRRWRGRRLSVLGDGLLIASTAVLTALPLLHYMAEHPDLFWYRAATRAGSVERSIGAEPLALFARNLWNMLLAFDWKGASTWVVVRQYDPFLDAVTASFWIAGIVLLAAQIIRGSLRWALVAVGLFVLTLPSTLSLAFPEENPSINRSGTAIPAVFVVASLAVVALLPRRRGAMQIAASVGLSVLLLFSVALNFRQYFVDFHDSYDRSEHHAIPMARVLDGYRKQGVPLRQMYLLYSDFWVDGRNIAFELGDPSWSSTQILPTGEMPPPTPARPLVFLHTPGAPILAELKRTYPGGNERVVLETFSDRNFAVYYVP